MTNTLDHPMPADVAAVYDEFLPTTRAILLDIRALIFDVATEKASCVGLITETLKWGEPAYLTQETGSGSIIRLGCSKRYPEQPTLFFNCKTSLISEFRELFSYDFQFEGNRAMRINDGYQNKKDQIKICIATALTYHIRP